MKQIALSYHILGKSERSAFAASILPFPKKRHTRAKKPFFAMHSTRNAAHNNIKRGGETE